MSSKTTSDDVSVLLYMIPFIASGVYGIYLGVTGGVSHLLSSSVYLDVTRDPIIFLIGTLGVGLGVVMEVYSTGADSRRTKLGSISSNLQVIAAASFILALICALYANGGSISGAASDFISGRFSIIFPILMVGFSYLLIIPLRVGDVEKPAFLGFISMLLVPLALHEIGKRNSAAGLSVSLVLIAVGAALFWKAYRTADQKKMESAGR